jgi:thiol-disulfide isomerase/thioredoxin
MRISTVTAAVFAAAMLAAAAGFLAYRTMIEADASVAAAAELSQLHLPDLSGKDQNLSQWRNGVLVVNFWATWCEPCRDEIPALLRVQAAYGPKGVQIVGIAVDSADKVRQFADEYRIGYPLLIGGIGVIDLAQKLGNNSGGLPYTVVMNSAGKVVVKHLGRISEAELEHAIQLANG